MGNDNEKLDLEIRAMADISAALGNLTDDQARKRVIDYVFARFLPGEVTEIVKVATTGGVAKSIQEKQAQDLAPPKSEIPGIAKLTEGGIQMTIRDLKARSKLDAAVRMAHVAVYATQLLEDRPMSSSKGLTPLLKTWRLYDSNTRGRIAKEKGIVRTGDDLCLDAHAKLDAERYIAEINDSSIEGKWKPN